MRSNGGSLKLPRRILWVHGLEQQEQRNGHHARERPPQHHSNRFVVAHSSPSSCRAISRTPRTACRPAAPSHEHRPCHKRLAKRPDVLAHMSLSTAVMAHLSTHNDSLPLTQPFNKALCGGAPRRASQTLQDTFRYVCAANREPRRSAPASSEHPMRQIGTAAGRSCPIQSLL